MHNFPYGFLIALAAAELFLLLAKGEVIKTLAKRRSQRTAAENRAASQGLARGLAIELLVLVPASVCLFQLTLLPLLKEFLLRPGFNEASFYALTGVVSYGFPFATVRRIVTRLALKTLQEFSSLVAQPLKGDGSADR